MHIDLFIEKLQDVVSQLDQVTYDKCVDEFMDGRDGEEIIKQFACVPIVKPL